MSTAPIALPERVRARVIAYAADALGVLPPDHVPGPLKRAAVFTPQRRARIAGQQILDHLYADDAFRERIGVQAKVRQAAVADELADGTATADTAALAFLVRPDGWESLLVSAAGAESAVADDARAGAETEVLRRRLEAALDEQAAIKRAAKEDLAAAKTEIADLRRKLGDSRSRVRAAQADLERTSAESAERLGRLEADLASAEAEARRLRGQVTAVTAELTRAQRAARAGREEGTLRARLLLDTLLQSAQGLRQELALPVVSGSPADRVEAHLAETGARESSGTASLSLDDPALVRELLTLPQLHLIVDGYNVTRAEWDDASLEAQRTRLLAGLRPLAARTGVEITVVFDGAKAETRPVVQQPRGVRVLFSPRDVLADDVIRELVAVEPAGRPIAVVTSDQEIVRDVVRKAGVRVVGARAMVRLIS
ncbi:MAG TPA: NYN domain-containing protein [Marmoricola sp.]|nr:NYN domain-containing protein [Marmoricola sp.]